METWSRWPGECGEIVGNNGPGEFVSLCAGCYAVVRWEFSEQGKWRAVDPDGEPHGVKCPAIVLHKLGRLRRSRASLRRRWPRGFDPKL